MSRRTMQTSVMVTVAAVDLDFLHLKNEAHPPNTNDDGANASGTLLLGPVVNTEKTRIGEPAFGRTCSSKPESDHGRGGITSDGTGKRWSSDIDKSSHEQYRRAQNNYKWRATAADTTDATGTVICRGSRRTHVNGSAKGISRRQIVGNEQCSNEGGSGGATRIEGAGIGVTRRIPHHDGADHLGVRCRKVAHHQGGTFGKAGFSPSMAMRICSKSKSRF